MAINPWTVRSPKSRLDARTLRVVHTVPAWSLAIGVWDGRRSLLIRWNGDADHPLGNPQSHAQPTWFVLPDSLHYLVLSVAETTRVRALEWLENRGPEECETIAVEQ